MNLLEKIEQEMKTALKSGDSVRSETLKMIKSDISYEKGKTGKEITDELVLEIVGRSAKRRRESIKEFQKGGRQDLVDIETKQLAVVEEFLPKQMTEEEIDAHITNKLAALGTITQKEIGRVMGEIMKELKGKADGSAVKAILSKKIGGN
ncbi:MAG TPA: GatB/YqeY domain-containing protein [Spirochaetota bacterium]|nr:GatB/YqeY domain-containing protein [Spirochaetota bacterium]HOD15983.1 GatB/YqeY domain-containing protein [Spirochaetota bacterium]HPG50501.1 GatB/YqeY domain-containing protein [Spirochaetota bacterium]HPN12224.1 GatB/YqeY domain-containing protein [Spirochaetota bacterium]HQL83004.1 GatB/YqeY domain-containing protein [Spirochaetota bacterium]